MRRPGIRRLQDVFDDEAAALQGRGAAHRLAKVQAGEAPGQLVRHAADGLEPQPAAVLVDAVMNVDLDAELGREIAIEALQQGARILAPQELLGGAREDLQALADSAR
jgi:hypothetical protein